MEIPEETPEVTPEEDPEEAPAKTTVESSEINAVADTESTITVEYKTEDKDAEGNDIAGKESDAEVVFLGGCVSSDKKLAEGRDLRFKVEPAAGRVVTKVEHQIGEAPSGTPIEASGGVYTVGKGSFVVSEKAVNGKIIITTKAVNYKVSFSAAEGGVAASAYAIHPVVDKSAEDKTKVLGTAVTEATDLVYGKSGEFAIVISGTAYKLVSITLNGEEIKTTASELNKSTDEVGTPKTKCYTFTVDPSKTEGLKDATTVDTTAAVKVKVVAKAKLTVAFGSKGNSTVEGVTNAAEAQINYDGSKFGTDSTFVEDDDTNLAKSLVFKVTPDENYKVTDVTAKATTDENTEGTAVTVTKGTAAADGSVDCTIALSQVKGFTVDTNLTISIATDWDTTKDAVHTITFKDKDGKVPAHVTITHGTTAANTELKGSSVTVANATYKIKVDPDKGYELEKGTNKTEDDPNRNDNKYVVTVKESRTYAAIEADEANNKPAVSAQTKDVTTEVEAYKGGAAVEIALSLTGSDKYADTDAADRDYTVKTVEVTVNATVIKNDAEKLVAFTDDLGAGYKITTEGVIHNEEAGDEENSWVIPATVDVLTFTVTSAKEPAVTVGDADVEGTVADGVYTYSYPAAALAAGTTPTEIVISDNSTVEKKAVKVKVDPADVMVEYDEAEVDFDDLEDPDADGYYTIDAAAVAGEPITLTFKPNDGVAIDKVSYTMGEENGNGTVNRDKSVSLTLTVTDNVIVDVESKSDYRVVLKDEGGKDLTKDGDAYVADYTDTDIGIVLTKAGVTYTGNLYDVVVKDGAKTAATEAKVAENGSTATIAKIAESERGKDLTIEVYIDKSTKYTTTLKTNIVSEEVTVSRVVNGKDTKVAENATVDIMPDARMAFTVTPAKGASLSDLAVEILAKDGAALTAETSPIVGTPSIENGIFTVTTKPGAAKDTEVLVSIYNVHEEKATGVTANTSLKGGKFVLKLTDPLVKSAEISKVNAAAGSATNRAVRLNVSVDFKNKKNHPAAPIQGDLYYKVDFTAPTGAPANVTVIPATTKYVKVDDYANTAKTIELALVTANTEDKAATEETAAVIADIAEQISTTAKVTLVQSLSTTNLETAATVADTDYVAGPEAAKDSTLTTKKPVYETKLSVKTVNGAAVFTGQSDAKVATPVFGKDTSYDNITVQFVDTKTGVLRGNSGSDAGDPAYYGSYFTAWVADDNSIHVGITDEDGDVYASSYKTLGVKVTAVGPDDSYKASAVVKLKVQQGIFAVDVDESKAQLPDTIFKDPKKAASVKITPLLNWGSKEQKPAKAAVTWEIAPAYGNNSTYAAAAVTGKKPLVSVKNGTVSIAKDYQVQTADVDNKFTVTIRANDFAGNGETTYYEYDFEITDQKNEISRLVIRDYFGGGEEKNPASLTAEDFDDRDSEGERELYVVAEDAKGNPLPVTFKSSNAKALAVSTASGHLTFYKPADKIKITATTVDGGKAPKAELVINVKPYKQVGLSIVGEDSSSGLDETDIHYSGGSNERYYLYASYKDGNNWFSAGSYKNLKVTVKGGKLLANSSWAKGSSSYMGSAVVVTDKSGKATITVTDTANKDKATNHKDYIITNDNPTAVKAPSIKLYDPKKVALGTEAITWQVTDKNNDNYAGSYVKLTSDYMFTGSNSAYTIVDHYDYNSESWKRGTILKIDENGRFTLDSRINYTGAYKMVATVGTMVGGEFVASAKDVKLSFNIAVKKYNSNLTVKNSYTLDAKSASTARIDVKTDYNYEISGAMNVIKKVQGKDDHTNAFTTYFEVKPITYEYQGNTYVSHYTIGLKPGLSAEQIEYITSKEGKNDCTGYITVSNGYGNMNSLYNRLNTKDVQVKISFKANKYGLTNATIFSNGTAATTPVTATVRLMNGKIRDYAALVAVDAADDGRFVAATNPISFNNGDIVITSKTEAIAPGKYDVKLIVVPQSSSFVKWDEATQKWIYANDKTTGGTALTDAELMAKAGIPVTAKIDVKAVDTKSIAKANLNVTLSTQLYEGSNGNGYVQATSTTGGYYQVDVPYTIAIGGSDISAVDSDVKVTLTNNEVTLADNTKEALVKAAKAVGYDSDGNEIPVIRLQVSKKALVTLNGMDKKDKPITAYGKKLKVPVEIKYTNGITTTDTLNFNITMPKKAPVDFEGVQTIIADNQAVIEKIQTRLAGTAQTELTILLNDVCNKVRGLVPADTDVRVSYLVTKKYLNDGEKVEAAEETNTPDYDGIMNAGKAKITLLLTDLTKASANTKDVSFTYTLGMNAKDSDLEAVKEAIEDIDYKFTNDTTAATLLADIKADDTVKDLLGARKGHLSLKVSSFDRTPATTKNSGEVEATILVKDLVTGDSEDAEIYGTIGQLSNLTQAKTAVNNFFTEANVKELVNNCSGQETTIKEAILKAANEKAGNKDITIDFKADAGTTKGWNYEKPEAAVMEENGTTEKTPAKAGKISFTLVLTKAQADGSRSAEVSVAEITIDADNAAKYVAPADMKKKVDAEITTDKLKALAESKQNKGGEIKQALEGQFAALTGAVEGYKLEWAKKAGSKPAEDDFTYEPATQEKAAKLSFKVVLTLKGDGSSQIIPVEVADVLAKADKYQTAAELKAKIEAMSKTIESNVAVTDANANNIIKTEAEKLIGKDSGLEVTVTRAAGNEDTTKNSVFTEAGEGTDASLTNVTITIDDDNKVTVEKFTFKVTPTTPPEAE